MTTESIDNPDMDNPPVGPETIPFEYDTGAEKAEIQAALEAPTFIMRSGNVTTQSGAVTAPGVKKRWTIPEIIVDDSGVTRVVDDHPSPTALRSRQVE